MAKLNRMRVGFDPNKAGRNEKARAVLYMSLLVAVEVTPIYMAAIDATPCSGVICM